MIPPLRKLSIEVSSICNFNCTFCIPHRKGSKIINPRPPFMDFKLFTRIVSQYSSGFGIVSPQFQGEPLMHPQFLQICWYLEEMRVPFRFNTNGQLLTHRLSNELSKMKHLLGITFSIDGITRETFEKIRIGSNFHKVMENVRYAIEVGIPCGVNFVICEDNQLELPSVVKYFLNTYRVRVTASIVTDDEGMPNGYFWKPEERLPCLPDSAIVLTNGDVIPCCRDHKYEWVMGNLERQSLSEVWLDERYRSFWNLQERYLFNSNLGGVNICGNCATWMCEVVREGRTEEYIEGIIATYYPFWVEFWRKEI